MSENKEEKRSFLIRMAANLLTPYHYNEEKAWKKIRQQTIDRKERTLKFHWLKYAAVFVAGVGVAWLGYQVVEERSVTDLPVLSAIVSYGQQAELVLASGQRVILDDSIQGKDISRAGMVVHVDSVEKCLKYGDLDTTVNSKITGYNTLRVPRGGEYTLILADGSTVRLNAESSLRFPVAFEKEKREVYLEGEAFFEVKPNKDSPFHVFAAGRDICVLGTSFNVSAYENDTYFSSTLVTGKVKVSGGRQEVTLKPSQQYLEDQHTGKVEVKKVDTELYTSWLEGKIRFKSERLEDIVKKLERWFQFEIFYANEEVKDMRFRGVINKYDSFATVLKNLEQTTDIRFNIQGNTVIARKIYNN